MKKYMLILILFPLTVFISCNIKQKPTFNKHLIENLSNAQIDLPSHYSEIIFFCKSQNKKILPLNANDFRYIYSKEFSKLDYKLFLTRLLNQELDVQYNNKKSFEINKFIENHYKSMDFISFMNFYCVKISKSRYTLKNDVLKNQRYSIFYFLFINNYQTSFDDLGGMFIIKKIE